VITFTLFDVTKYIDCTYRISDNIQLSNFSFVDFLSTFTE